MPPPVVMLSAHSILQGVDADWVRELELLLGDLKNMATADAKRRRLMDFLDRGLKLPTNVLSADDRSQAVWLLRSQQAELVVGPLKQLGIEEPTELLAARSSPLSMLAELLGVKPRFSPEHPADTAASAAGQ